MAAEVENLLAIPGAFINAVATNGEGMQAFDIGILTIAVMILWGSFAPKRLQVMPAPLVAIIVATIAASIHHLGIHHVAIPDNIWSTVSVAHPAGLCRRL
ncbi:MAG: hypothetical protein MZV65_28350 [Chromatiales bacterium]|nr:hypothetical protein [Chromatiales bacterium]